MDSHIRARSGRVMDSAASYGLVSQVLHWGMAGLFLLQLLSSLARYFWEDTAIEKLLWPTHSEVGIAPLILVFLRGSWGIANLSKRPPHGPGPWGRAASLGHAAFYALMIVVPLVAVLRSIGSGRGIEFLGVETVAWTVVEASLFFDWLGDALHGELGWALFALIFGHTLAAIFHVRLFGTSVIHKMGLGRTAIESDFLERNK